RDAAAFERVDERVRDVLLTDEVAELLRPVAARDDGVRRYFGDGRRRWRSRSGFRLGHRDFLTDSFPTVTVPGTSAANNRGGDRSKTAERARGEESMAAKK